MTDVLSVDERGDDSLLVTSIESKSPKRLSWDRFKRDRFAIAGLAVVIFFLLIAIFAPLITKILGISPNALDRDSLNDYGLPNGRFGGISGKHWLGVEPGTGRDILARLIYGARLSLFVGLVATLITTSVGMVLGLIAGYLRGRVDTFLSRLSDLVMTFPSLILTIALVRPGTQRLEAMGVPEGNPARLTYLMLVTLFFGWVGFFRIVRGQTMALREREFVEAARSSGAGSVHILFRQIAPNLWGPIIALASMSLPGYVAYEAALSFLGVGIIAPTASWGIMLQDSVHFYRADPTYFFIPGATLFVLVMAFYLLSEGLRDALDPKNDRQQVA